MAIIVNQFSRVSPLLGVMTNAGNIIATNTANPTADSTDTGTAFTFNVDIGSGGANRVIAIAVALGGNNTFPKVSSLTVAGNSASLANVNSIGTGDSGGNEDFTGEIWDIAGEAATGNQDIVVNLTAAQGDGRLVGISVWELLNCNSTANDGNGDGVNDATTQLDVDLNTISGGFIISAASSFRSSVTNHTWTGITEVDEQAESSHRISFAGNTISSGSTPLSIDVQCNVTNGFAFGAASASYQPA